METVTVGDRTYAECLKLVTSLAVRGQAIHSTSYIAPGIGPVWMQMEFPAGIKLDLRLKDHRL